MNQISVSKQKTYGERLSPEVAAAILANPPAILNVPEAAALCRVSPRTMRDHIAARRVPVVRFGGRVLISRDELLRTLDQMTVKAIA